MFVCASLYMGREENQLDGRRSGALHLTADHQQPRHYTPYAVITQVQSRARDDGHLSARNVLSRLQVQ